MTNREKAHSLLNDAIVKYNINAQEINSCEQMINQTENYNKKVAEAYVGKKFAKFGATLGTILAGIATGAVAISGGFSIWLVLLGGLTGFQVYNWIKARREMNAIKKEFVKNYSMTLMYSQVKCFLETYGKYLENRREDLRALCEQKQLTEEQIAQKLTELAKDHKDVEDVKNIFVAEYEAIKQEESVEQGEQQEI